MKKKKIPVIILIAILIIIGLIILVFFNKSDSKSISFLKAIEKVYSSEIEGMAVVINKTTDLRASDVNNYNIVTGSKEDNFSSNNKDGVKLWATEQLLLSLGSLKVIKEDFPEGLKKDDGDLYLIQTNEDFADKKSHEIRYLYVFVNTYNYHIYIPKIYCEPDKLINSSNKYMEYEPNEITKTLIKLILEI